MSDESAFLEMLRANPADDTARLVYADWLDERDEPQKAQYLRAVADLAWLTGGTPEYTAAAISLFTACPHTDLMWRNKTGARFDVVLERFDDKIRVIRLIHERIGCGLAGAKALAESVPVAIFSWLPFEAALPDLLAFGHPNAGRIEACVRPTALPQGAPGAEFDILLCALHPETSYGRNFPVYFFVAQTLSLSTDEATARPRSLPVMVASGLHSKEVIDFIHQMKLACNVGQGLPSGAIRVVPRLPS